MTFDIIATLNTIWEWLRTNIETVFAIGSAIIAVFSAAAARRETGRQRALQTETLRQAIDRASLEWGGEAISVLSRAQSLAERSDKGINTLELVTARADLAEALSALVDRGRLFFPNVRDDGHGAQKESAFQGHRPPILDALMFVYYEMRALGSGNIPGEDACAYVVQCRRLFVSELQAHLDPRRLDTIVGRYDAQREADRNAALYRTGELRLVLEARRPGLVPGDLEHSWARLLNRDDREAVMAAIRSRHGHPDPENPDPAEAHS